MKILAADDENGALNVLCRAIKEAQPDTEIRRFERSMDVITAMQDGYKPDIAFVDIEMPGLTGIELAKKMKSIHPTVNVIFVTGFARYAIEAVNLYCSGYVMKPVTADIIRREMNNLRYPIEKIQEPKLRIQTFGNFEVFAEDKPLKFRYSKTKELFAYLVDRRGASVNTSEICVILWENDDNIISKKSQLRKFIADLSATLSKVGAGDIIIKHRNMYSVDVTKVDCDYYRYQKRDSLAVFFGEYMSQYSWAEETLASITDIGI